jgi:YfiH family protein
MIRFVKNKQGYYYIDPGPEAISMGVTGRGINSVNYDLSDSEIRTAEKKILNDITGIITRRIVMLEQVHGDNIIHVVGYPTSDPPSVAEADGLITALKGVMLVIRTADCVPVILYDPEREVLGIVHSGWKGTMLNIAGKCIKEMKSIYSSDPENISAFILPSIGAESYEVNKDVADFFPEDTIIRDGRLYVDLWKSITDSLMKEGIKPAAIFNPYICNRINHREFFSYRFGDKGRNLNFAFMK